MFSLPPVIDTEAALKLEELMAENAALREELTARRAEQQKTYVPKPLDISEYRTRKLYIDAMLADAGWKEGKNWLPSSKRTRMTPKPCALMR